MRLDLIVGKVWPCIFQRLAHLGPKPGIMRLAARDELEGQHTLVGGAGEENRTASDTVRPMFSSTADARSRMSASILVWTSAFAGMLASFLDSM